MVLTFLLFMSTSAGKLPKARLSTEHISLIKSILQFQNEISKNPSDTDCEITELVI